MSVLGVRTVKHLDHDLIAVRTAPAGLDDGAGADRVDGGAGRGVEVDPGVAAGGPQAAAGPVGGRHVGGADGRHVGGQALALGLPGGALLVLAGLLDGLLGGFGGLSAGGFLGRALGGGFFGGQSLGGGLGVYLLGHGVAEGDEDRGEAGLLGGGLGGEGRGREGADHSAGGGAATPAARAVVRCIRPGRRCLPVARVNAMYGLAPFPSLSPTGLADGFGAGRSPTDPLAGRAGVRFTPGTAVGPRLPWLAPYGDSAMAVRCRGCGALPDGQPGRR
ncbi:hypothetical protein SFUMM280S_04735 [Streptomyces fumanus]